MTGSGYPEAVIELIGYLKSLPGIGARTAERLALQMLTWSPMKLQDFGQLLQGLPERVTECAVCGNFAESGSECFVCQQHNRDESLICVVEKAMQIQAMESTGFFKGRYHVLGGKISPLNGIGPDQLNIAHLIERATNADVKEIVIALSGDVEGQATVAYLKEVLQDCEVTVSCLAQGIPAGGDISYADSATLTAAFKGRT